MDLPVLDFAYKQNQAGHAPAEPTSLTKHQVLKAPGCSLCQTLTPFHENNIALCGRITLRVCPRLSMHTWTVSAFRLL